MAIICPYDAKCAACGHYRPDPDRDGERSCHLAHDRRAIPDKTSGKTRT